MNSYRHGHLDLHSSQAPLFPENPNCIPTYPTFFAAGGTPIPAVERVRSRSDVEVTCFRALELSDLLLDFSDPSEWESVDCEVCARLGHAAQVTICQKCGDPGISIALIYCDKCQEVAEHRYCLDVIPKTFSEYVTWFCKDCDPKDPAIDEVKIQSFPPRKISQTQVKIQQTVSAKVNQKRKRSRKSGKKKSESIARSWLKSTLFKDDTLPPVGKESCHSAQPSYPHSTRICAMDQIHDNGAVGINALQSSKCEVNAELAMRKIDINIRKASTFEVSSQPIFEPVWRGCFTLCVGEFGIIDGLAGHLSTKASLQVYEEARLLPESLCPELLPRRNIWPKGFVEPGPKGENIGLYFFPQKERYEKQYDILVDHMIEYDLAMRASGANADLLIFTSMELPLNNWRFQAKYYIWGVFRRKNSSSSRMNNPALTCNPIDGNTTLSSPEATEIAAQTKKSHMRGSPHSPLSVCSSHGSGS